MNEADQTILAVERAIAELRAGRAVVLRRPDGSVLAFRAGELAVESGEPVAEEAAPRLLKLAQLLPSAVSAEMNDLWLQVTAAQVDAYRAAEAETLIEIAEAKLPLKATTDAWVKVFRAKAGGVEHLAVLVGASQQQDAPAVRVHSSCLTGDLLGSLRCDCGDQLQLALEILAAEGGGVLCYLNQEGRGIGIGNKIRAYQLQDQGQDTLEANESLGFDADERDFALAAAMLKKLGIKQLRLLTNNPLKVAQLAAYGVEVVERLPLKAEPHAHNQDYLATKSRRMGHYF